MRKPTIIGGNTPFVPASEVPFVKEIRDTQPLDVVIEGKDETRTTACVMLAYLQRRARGQFGKPAELRDFVKGALAAANTDLRATGRGPLISYAEVDEFERALDRNGWFDEESGGAA